jgi:hypothetical protein
MPVHDWTRVNAGIFHDFHHEWISSIKHALNSGLLPPDYYALAEQIAGGLGPDVLTLENVTPSEGKGGKNAGGSGPLALATAPPKVTFTASAEPERYARKRKRVVIRHASGDEVVAVLEVLSPGNKASRNAVRTFVSKSLELLEAGIHLSIIDLFPPSSRDPQGIHGAIWSEIMEDDFQLPKDKPLTLVSYLAAEVKRAFVEPVRVGMHLSDLPLFLDPDHYVQVPLETAYQAAFAAVPLRWRKVLEPE